MEFVFLSGSFHQHSRSIALLKHIESLFSDHQIHTPQLDILPFYSNDHELKKPHVIQAFLELISSADGILVCSPEYNHSIPAVLKNAIDWASRPAFSSPLKDMPVSIITQAVSPVGGARAQAHIKLIFDSTLSIIQPSHEMMITQVDQAFDENMNLINDKIKTRLERHCLNFIDFVSRQK